MHEKFNECIKVAEKKNEMSFVIKGNGLWQESDKKEEVAGVRRWNRSFQGKREETITFIVSLGSKVGNLTFCCSTSIKYVFFTSVHNLQKRLDCLCNKCSETFPIFY